LDVRNAKNTRKFSFFIYPVKDTANGIVFLA
jgi:hypothetical protein